MLKLYQFAYLIAIFSCFGSYLQKGVHVRKLAYIRLYKFEGVVKHMLIIAQHSPLYRLSCQLSCHMPFSSSAPKNKTAWEGPSQAVAVVEMGES